MTKEQIEQKAKNIYMRCFDDDFEYTDVLHALEICAEETATEATRELEAQIEKMKCGQNCKHSYLYQEDRKCKFTYCDCVNCKEKWELRRQKKND